MKTCVINKDYHIVHVIAKYSACIYETFKNIIIVAALLMFDLCLFVCEFIKIYLAGGNSNRHLIFWL